jgi:hypothetical protein
MSKGFGSLDKQPLRPLPDELRSFSVQQFVLNTVFRTPFEEKARARSFNLIRRTLNAIEEYELARASYETIFPAKTVGASTETGTPVRGFRPVRPSRNFTKKAPNPRSSTRSPRAIAAAISEKMKPRTAGSVKLSFQNEPSIVHSIYGRNTAIRA